MKIHKGATTMGLPRGDQRPPGRVGPNAADAASADGIYRAMPVGRRGPTLLEDADGKEFVRRAPTRGDQLILARERTSIDECGESGVAKGRFA
jgi:hypothetical protein